VEKFNEILGPDYWPQPKARREYYGMNLELVKRFSHNWQGGVNYTLSLTKGNYGGLSSTDEFGRNSPNVERSFDLWFMMYQFNGTELNGPLPQDRTHYLKAYGSYSFPIGLTVGVTGYGKSGNPMSTRLPFNNAYIYPEGYGDLGRLPWTIWADVYFEWAVRIGGKFSIALNGQISNIADCRTWQHYRFAPTRNTANLPDPDLSRGLRLEDLVPNYGPTSPTQARDSQYKFNNQFGRRSVRFGAGSRLVESRSSSSRRSTRPSPAGAGLFLILGLSRMIAQERCLTPWESAQVEAVYDIVRVKADARGGPWKT
jgi:hypothetical protein